MKHITCKILICLAFGLAGLNAAAQQYNQENDDYDPLRKKWKLGIHAGLSISDLISPDLVNARAARGLQGAFYYRINLFKGFHLNVEFGGSFKGAKFRNGDTGYSRISLFYADLPVLGMINLDKKNKSSLIVGAQASLLMRSSLFLGKEQFASFLQLPFKTFDYYGILGYHYNFEYIGLQLNLKYGFNNVAGDFATFQRSAVNSSKRFDDITPSLRGVKKIQNFAVEISMYF